MKIKNILRKFSNKYVIATLVFVAVIVFIDQYNVFEQGKSIRKLRKMKKQEENYNYEIKIIRVNVSWRIIAFFILYMFVYNLPNKNIIKV